MTDDADDNPIRKVLDEAAAEALRPKRPSKSNRLLTLAEPQFSRFQKYCRAKKMSPSGIVDKLIAVFMDEAEEDVRHVLGAEETDPDKLPSPRRGGR